MGNEPGTSEVKEIDKGQRSKIRKTLYRQPTPEQAEQLKQSEMIEFAVEIANLRPNSSSEDGAFEARKTDETSDSVYETIYTLKRDDDYRNPPEIEIDKVVNRSRKDGRIYDDNGEIFQRRSRKGRYLLHPYQPKPSNADMFYHDSDRIEPLSNSDFVDLGEIRETLTAVAQAALKQEKPFTDEDAKSIVALRGLLPGARTSAHRFPLLKELLGEEFGEAVNKTKRQEGGRVYKSLVRIPPSAEQIKEAERQKEADHLAQLAWEIRDLNQEIDLDKSYARAEIKTASGTTILELDPHRNEHNSYDLDIALREKDEVGGEIKDKQGYIVRLSPYGNKRYASVRYEDRSETEVKDSELDEVRSKLVDLSKAIIENKLNSPWALALGYSFPVLSTLFKQEFAQLHQNETERDRKTQLLMGLAREISGLTTGGNRYVDVKIPTGLSGLTRYYFDYSDRDASHEDFRVMKYDYLEGEDSYEAQKYPTEDYVIRGTRLGLLSKASSPVVFDRKKESGMSDDYRHVIGSDQDLGNVEQMLLIVGAEALKQLRSTGGRAKTPLLDRLLRSNLNAQVGAQKESPVGSLGNQSRQDEAGRGATTGTLN